ncbi:hypothetical protein ACIOWI_33050 [Streptomyces sp. NPDC087659]|uniref:hypothetical protein n=1 Tax=Streptomyces sp. NPDC087659 TaxID=3365801 RepID=UPI0038301554
MASQHVQLLAAGAARLWSLQALRHLPGLRPVRGCGVFVHVRGLTALHHPQLLAWLGLVEGSDSPALGEDGMAYGQFRMVLLDRAAAAAGRLAGVAQLAVRLASRTRLTPTDVYAAVATARFMAAHELIDRAAAEAAGPETELIQIRQPLWFGGTTIHEETHP